MKHPSLTYALVGTLGLLSATTGTANEAQSARWPGKAGSAPGVSVGLRKHAGRVEFFAVGWPSALKIHGKGAGADGNLKVAGSEVTGSLSFDLQTLDTGIALRDRHMKETYLETARFPQATLQLSRLDTRKLPTGDDFGPIAVPFEGVLTLHGVKKPVAGEAKVTRTGPRLGGTAEFVIKLQDFDIKAPSYLGITVAEKVQVKASFSTMLEHGEDVAER